MLSLRLADGGYATMRERSAWAAPPETRAARIPHWRRAGIPRIRPTELAKEPACPRRRISEAESRGDLLNDSCRSDCHKHIRSRHRFHRRQNIRNSVGARRGEW